MVAAHPSEKGHFLFLSSPSFFVKKRCVEKHSDYTVFLAHKTYLRNFYAKYESVKNCFISFEVSVSHCFIHLWFNSIIQGVYFIIPKLSWRVLFKYCNRICNWEPAVALSHAAPQYRVLKKKFKFYSDRTIFLTLVNGGLGTFGGTFATPNEDFC